METVEIETGTAPTATVVWLHGLGTTGHDFAPIVDELALPVSLAVRFVFPHASLQAASAHRDSVMRAWYEVREHEDTLHVDPGSILASEKRIHALIARERQRGILPERVVLAGFSQGGAMALHAGLRYPQRLAGIVALSCLVPLPDMLAMEASTANRDLPILLVHGTEDARIPQARAWRDRDILLALGYPVVSREYPMAHSICREEIRGISAWLTRLLRPPYEGFLRNDTAT